MKTIEQAGKFAFVGIINTILDFAILNVLIAIGFSATFMIFGQKILIANIISVSIAMINSFILNRQWAFRSQNKNVAMEIVKFSVITLFGMFVVHQLIFSFFLYRFTSFTGIAYRIIRALSLPFSYEFTALNISKVIAVVGSLIWNFFGYKFFVFVPTRGGKRGISDGINA